MSWSTLKTWVVGEIVTAAMMNEQIRDKLSALWPYTTKGDLPVASGPNDLTRLPIGAAKEVLRVDPSTGLPVWKAMWPYTTKGDLPVAADADTLSRLGIGSTWSVLHVDPNGIPAWRDEGIGVMVVAPEPQTITHNTWTTLTGFSVYGYDTPGYFNASSPDRLSIPTGVQGFHVFGVGGTWASSGDSNRRLTMALNVGGYRMFVDDRCSIANEDLHNCLSGGFNLGDEGEIKVDVLQKTGSNLDISDVWFWLVRI